MATVFIISAILPYCHIAALLAIRQLALPACWQFGNRASSLFDAAQRVDFPGVPRPDTPGGITAAARFGKALSAAGLANPKGAQRRAGP
jgi:hypothetical protein